MSANAQYNLGLCYESGVSMDKNLNAAARCYRWAQSDGHLDAMFRLGLCYEHGRGVTKDLEMAIECYGEAAEAGHQDSIQRLKYHTVPGDESPPPEPQPLPNPVTTLRTPAAPPAACIDKSCPCRGGEGGLDLRAPSGLRTLTDVEEQYEAHKAAEAKHKNSGFRPPRDAWFWSERVESLYNIYLSMFKAEATAAAAAAAAGR